MKNAPIPSHSYDFLNIGFLLLKSNSYYGPIKGGQVSGMDDG